MSEDTEAQSIAYVIEQMATSETVEHDSSLSCLYCDGTPLYGDDEPLRTGNYIENFIHETSCPVSVARGLLKEQGTPLGVYRLTGEILQSKARKREVWKGHTQDVLAISEEKAVRQWSHVTTRNVQVQFIAEWSGERQARE